MNKIIFGGAFDPIHNGHINMALKASKELEGEVIFVPARISVWKSVSAPISDKMAMLKLATKDYPFFSIDEFEINSGKDINYSIDTIKYFQKKYPKDKLFYLIGYDQVNEFHRWKDAEELSSIAQIVYYTRPNYKLSEENVNKYHMIAIEGDGVDVSSTEVRALTSFEVPDEVLFYIVENDLYEGMVEINKIESKHRIDHSRSVAKLAYQIAKANNLKEPIRAYIAGLFHDIGKDIPLAEQMELTKRVYPEYADVPKFAYHQFAGAVLAHEKFKIDDEEILDAIKFHSTGSDNMRPLAKIIYASDKIEPTRGFNSNDLIDAMLKNVDTGFKIVLQANKDFLENGGKMTDNYLTSNCFKKYL